MSQTLTKIKVHYMDTGDDEVVAEIILRDYYKLLKNYSGRELAKKLDAALVVLNTDPRQSELNATDIFISYSDVFTKITFASHLLEELSPESVNTAKIELENSPWQEKFVP